jgi:hypothetical protein
VILDFEAMGIKGSKKNLAWLMSIAALGRLGLFPLHACEEAARRGQRPEVAEEMIVGLRAVVSHPTSEVSKTSEVSR